MSELSRLKPCNGFESHLLHCSCIKSLKQNAWKRTKSIYTNLSAYAILHHWNCLSLNTKKYSTKIMLNWIVPFVQFSSVTSQGYSAVYCQSSLSIMRCLRVKKKSNSTITKTQKKNESLNLQHMFFTLTFLGTANRSK